MTSLTLNSTHLSPIQHMYNDVQSRAYMSQQTISASQARKYFFKILDQVFKENDSFIIEKSGIPVAEIKSLQQRVINSQAYAKVLKATQGAWANEPIDKKREAKQRKLELQATERNKQAW